MYLKDNQNHIELEIKTSFQHNSTISTMFHQNSQQQLNSHHNSIIMKTHDINSSTTHLITATTTITDEFINNPRTTSFFINFEQNTKYTHLYISSMQIQHQQHNYHQIHILKHCIKS